MCFQSKIKFQELHFESAASKNKKTFEWPEKETKIYGKFKNYYWNELSEDKI